MKVANKKSVLILIIVLLVIDLPIAIFGCYAHFAGLDKVEKDNVNKDFKFDNKLYFYDNDVLLGKYECVNSGCDYVTETIDDDSYALDYYKDDNLDKIKLVKNRYAFINDGNVIKLYDVTTSRQLTTLSAVKDYTIGLDNDLYIAKNENGKWGVLDLSQIASTKITYEYDYIGVHKQLNTETNKLESNSFVVKDVNGWKIVSDTNVKKSEYFLNEIYDYNNSYVITKNNNFYYLNNYDGHLTLSLAYLHMAFVGNYVEVLDQENNFYIINPLTLSEISQKYYVSSLDDVETSVTDAGITISIVGQVMETVN